MIDNYKKQDLAALNKAFEEEEDTVLNPSSKRYDFYSNVGEYSMQSSTSWGFNLICNFQLLRIQVFHLLNTRLYF